MEGTGIKAAVLEEICAFAEAHCLTEVILFGSRARGDHTRASDIDLAVRGGRVAEFTLDVKEETSTLLDFDIIDLDQPLQPELREAIQKEGITLYEKV